MNDPKSPQEIADHIYCNRCNLWDNYQALYKKNKRHKCVFYTPDECPNETVFLKILKWWMDNYQLRENTMFKSYFEEIDHCYKHLKFDKDPTGELTKTFKNNYWEIVSGLLLTIYNTNPSYYDDMNTFKKNFHPLSSKEFNMIIDMYPRYDDFNSYAPSYLRPPTHWFKCHFGYGGRMCSYVTGYKGYNNNGVHELFERRTSTTSRGTSRVKLHHLLYTMIYCTIPKNHMLINTGRICDKKGITDCICINPCCYSTGPIPKVNKRKRGKGISVEQRSHAFFKEHPNCIRYILDHSEEFEI